MKNFILIVLLLLGACSKPPEENLPGWTEAKITPSIQEKWARSCALCHVGGEGGAPRMGDLEAWQPRLAQGQRQLLDNTLEGLNRMPPLGYCMDCSDEDFVAMIKMMSGEM